MRIVCICLWVLWDIVPSAGQFAEYHYLTNDPADDRFGSYSPDGSKILFESNRSGQWDLYMTDTSGKNIVRLTFHDSTDRSAQWHPYDAKIVFESNRTGSFEIFELDLVSNSQTQIVTAGCDGSKMFPAYAPEGGSIAVTCVESDSISNIIVIDDEGKLIKTVTEEPFRSYYPRWSPDGSQLLYFSRKRTGNRTDEIYKIDLYSGEELMTVSADYHRFCPIFSASGTHFAFAGSMENTRPEIFIAREDGTHIQRITDNDTGDTLPCWSPNDRSLLITTFRNGNFDLAVIPVQQE